MEEELIQTNEVNPVEPIELTPDISPINPVEPIDPTPGINPINPVEPIEPTPVNPYNPESVEDDTLGSIDCYSECKYHTGDKFKRMDYGYSD